LPGGAATAIQDALAESDEQIGDRPGAFTSGAPRCGNSGCCAFAENLFAQGGRERDYAGKKIRGYFVGKADVSTPK
jgi:hypothetical protein